MRRFSTLKHNSARFLAAVTLLLALPFASEASLSGSYTINGSASASSTNYQTFTAAISDLTSGTRTDGGTANGSGVSGAVVFKVANGSYNEQLTITPITGASTSNTVTFQSTSGDSSKVNLYYASSGSTSANNFLVYLKGADNIIFKQMTLQRTGSSYYGRLIFINGNANSNQFRNCQLIGTKNSSSTGYESAVVYSDTDNDTGNVFISNNIKYGSFHFYLYGSGSSSPERGLVVSKNLMDSAAYMGFYLYYMDNMVISENTMTNQFYYFGYGIYMYYPTAGVKITRNNMSFPNGATSAIYLSQMNGSSTNRSLIANNMISIEGTQYMNGGIYIQSASYLDLYNNSMLITNTYSNSLCLYHYSYNSATDNIVNNNFVNAGGGLVMNIYNSDINTMNNNNWYTTGSQLGRWSGTGYNDIASWKTGSGKDANAISVNPLFISNRNLHIQNPALNNKAVSLGIITQDIDGQTRSSTPDIGADEFTPPVNDAGATSFVTPFGNYCAGKSNVTVNLMNYGSSTLTSATINWKVNGSTQTAFGWTGTLAPGNYTPVTIGSYTFTSGTYNLVAYPSSPNGTTDGNNANDTATTGSILAGMSGTFIIGSSGSANYSTFTDAVTDLNAKGVCGAVTFTVEDGYYNEQISINNIPGTSSTNTVTFVSKSLDSSLVWLDWYTNGTGVNNFAVDLNGADWITFKKITLSRSGSPTSYYGRVVAIHSGAHHNSFLNCQLYGPMSNYYYYQHELVWSDKDVDSANHFMNNMMKYGTYGFYFFGSSNTAKETGTIIEGNIMDSCYGYGNYIYYQDNMIIRNNKVTNLNSNSSSYEAAGFYLYSCDNIRALNRNNIFIEGARYNNYGIYLSNCNNTSSNPVDIYNNMISVGGVGQYNTFGIYDYNSPYHNYYFNNILISSASYNSYAYMLSTYSGVTNIMDNNFVNKGGGYASYINSTGYVGTMNYNNLYTKGSNLGYWAGTTSTSLSAWKTSTSKDANSVSTDPGYVSNMDLHVKAVLLNSTGSPVGGISKDIDGDARNASTPDIGADEFIPSPLDASISALLSPGQNFCAGTTNVTVTLKNNGTTTLTKVTINWKVNTTTQTAYNWTGSLAPGATANVIIGTYSFTGTSNDIVVYSSSPNGGTDGDLSNDTSSAIGLLKGLNGTYTLGGASPDYYTFYDVVTDLTTRGVCGPVIINVRDGNYNEQVEITRIPGASATNTVIFQGTSSDSTKVEMEWGTNNSGTNNYIVRFNGGSYVTFKKMTFWRSGAGTNYYGRILEYTNGSSYNNILNCQLLAPTNPGAYYYQQELVYSSNSLDSNNHFMNSYMKGGTYTFYWFGASNNSKEKGTIVEGNIMDSAMGSGNYFYYQDGLIIRKNKYTNLSTGTTSSQVYGLNLYYCDNIVSISKNNIYIAGPNNTTYGIYIYQCANTSSQPGLISNNMITVDGKTASSTYGIQDNNSPYKNYYNNSIYVPLATNNSFGIYHYTYSGTSNFVNNCVVNTGGGQAAYLYGNYVGTSDYNNWYSSGSTMGTWNFTSYGNLAAWQVASGKDASSKSALVMFYSTMNLHTSSTVLNASGTPVSGVSDDIDGQARNSSTPDIGADEFTPPPVDAGILNLNNNTTNICPGSQTVYATLFNYGTNTLTSATINWKINGTAQTAYPWTGSLASGSSASVAIGTYTFVTATSYTIKVYSSNPNGVTDPVALNDTFTLSGSSAGLAGTYTIGGTSPDYATFTDAVKDLNTKGLCSSVIFNVRNGSYNEQIVIGSIAGASATSTVTFQSQSGDSSKVILYQAVNASYTATNYVIQLNGSKYVSFKKMTIARTGSGNYGRVIEIKSNANNNSILNNYIYSAYVATTGNFELVYSSTDIDTGNIIRNNLMKYGSSGILMYGSNTTAMESANIIDGNIIDSCYYMGIQLQYQNRVTISNNIITNVPYQYGYAIYNYYGNLVNISKNRISAINGINATGIYVYNSTGGNIINGNYVNIPNGTYGISLQWSIAPSTNPGVMANNMVIIGGSNTAYGIYDYYNAYSNEYYNSVNVTNTNSSSLGIYYYSYNSTASKASYIYNNLSVNTGGGPAMNIYSYPVNTMDYNNWYTNSSSFGLWNGTPYANLTAWKTATAMDANSYSVNPYFNSPTDLHVSNSSLNGTATVVSSVSDDYDGQTRNSSTPDIGADEFTPPALDAGISTIVDPNGGYCAGTKSVTVTLLNSGLNTLTSATINWSVNGVTQTAYSWTGSLTSGNTTNATIGSYAFSSATTYNIKVWSSSPNSGTDGNAANDTQMVTLKEGLSGTYTIGGTSPDFADFSAAAAALNKSGVCGAVTFNVRDGVYNQQISLGNIANTSATNTVTFQSQNGDSSKVILDWPSSNSNTGNFAVQLNGSDFISFKKITISRSGNYYYGVVVEAKSGANSVSFKNNRLLGTKNTTTSNSAAVVYSPQSNDSNLVFDNNLVKYGSMGLYLSGDNTSRYEKNIVVSNNTIDSASYMGIYLYYQDGAQITGNTINNLYYYNTYSSTFGIYGNYLANGVKISHNKMYLPLEGYGIYIQYLTGTSTDKASIDNNFISVGGSYNGYGIYTFYTSYTTFAYNNILTSQTGNGFGLYHYGYNPTYTNNDFANNNIVSTGTVPALYIGNASGVTNMDNNNYFVTGSTLGSWQGSTQPDLSSWQSASSRDANSLSIDPVYASKSDLHVNNPGLNGKATPITGITTDIDNQTRNSSTPDIGADEFSPAAVDAGVLAITNPTGNYCAGTRNVMITLLNYGTTTLTSATINWSVNGTPQTAFAWTGSLASGATASVAAGSFTFASNSSYAVKVWTSSPNGGTDGNNKNDTMATPVLKGGLSGTYTIGGSTPDYSTFTLAVADLNSKGVCGPVTFNVRDGNYMEQIVITSFPGSSATNTVTFQSQSGDSSKVKLYYGNASNPNYVVLLNGADYITFSKMSIYRSAAAYYYGRVIEMKGGANFNTFTHNRLSSVKPTNYYFPSEIIYSGQDNDHGNKFTNNAINSGTVGIYLVGAGGSPENHNEITDNIIDSTFNNGIFINYNDTFLISGNKISNMAYANGGGIYLQYCYGEVTVVKNKIYQPSFGYGIYMYFVRGNNSQISTFANNMITIAGSTNPGYGIYDYYANYHNIHYNSINITNTNSGSRGGYFGYCQNLDVENNSFAVPGGGMVFELPSASSTYWSNSDYNNLYTTSSSNFASFGGTVATDLSDWVNNVAYTDASSISANPSYTSSTDLHTSSAMLNNKGVPVTVTDDYDGQTRSSTTPDIGADEFSPPSSDDVTLSAIISPNSGICGTTNTRIGVKIGNNGSTTVTTTPVVILVTGATTATLKGTLPRSLASGATDTFTLPSSFNTISGGTYYLKAYTDLSSDVNRSNDTLKPLFALTIRTIPTPATIPNYSCGAGKMKLVASAKNAVTTWWDAASAGNLLKTGDTLTTGVLTKTTTYYAQSQGLIKDTLANSLFNGGNAFQGGMFDVTPTTDLTLDGLDLNLTGSSDSVEVYYIAGTYVGNETSSSSWTRLGAAYITPKGAGNATYIPVGGLSMTGGSTYGIYVRLQKSSSMRFKNSGVTISNMDMKISGNTYLNALFSSYGTGYAVNTRLYYSGKACMGPRVAVTASVTGAPTGASVIKGSLFDGSYNAGTAVNPDAICVTGIADYELVPPSSVTNSGFGTTWTISYLRLATAKGTVSNDTATTAPTSSTNAKLRFTPTTGSTDSTFILTLTIHDIAKNCDTTIRRYIYVSPKPTTGFTALSACPGAIINFSNTSSYGTSTMTWRWDFGDGGTSAAFSPNHAYAKGGLYTVKLVGKNAAGCADSISKSVTVYDAPVAKFGGTPSCKNVSFTDSSSVATGSISTYAWSFGDGNTSTLTSPSHTYATGGTSYTASLVILSNNGCKDSTSRVINIVPIPVAKFGARSVCLGDSVRFMDSTATTGLIYAWDFGDKTTGSAAQNPVHWYAAASSYTVSMKVTNSFGCSDSTTRLYTIGSSLILTVSKSIAQRDVTFTPSDTLLTYYKWTFGDGDSSFAPHPTHKYLADGKYYYTLIARNSTGCQAIITDSVVVKYVGIETTSKPSISVNIYPNPFQELTNISVQIPEAAHIRILVMDATGRKVATLIDGMRNAGTNQCSFDASQYNAPAGIYLLRIESDGLFMDKKIIRLK